MLATQFALVSRTFPLAELLSAMPLLYIDGAYHWLQVHVARELAAQGRLTGYDVTFAGGYLGGVTLNASAKGPALLAVLLDLDPERAYKIFVFAAAVGGPCMVPLTARILRCDIATTAVASVLGLCAWWATALRWYHSAGMVSFVFTCFVALPFVALVARSFYESQFAWTRALSIGSIGAAALLIHPLFPIPAAAFVAAHLLFVERSALGLRSFWFLCLLAVVSIAPNLPWIIGMLRADATLASVVQYQTRVDITVVPKELIGLWREDAMGAKLNVGLFAAAIVAACGVASRDRAIARAAVVGWTALVLFAAVGASLPGAPMVQPNRFACAAYLILLVPAAFGIQEAWRWLRGADLARRAFASAVLPICAASFCWSLAEAAHEASDQQTGRYGVAPPEVRPLGEKSRWLIDWLQRETTKEGRILFETSKGRIHDRAHMAGYYAVHAQREFVGGPYPFLFEAGFWDGVAFGRALDSMPALEFAHLVQSYNVGWAVVHSTVAKRFFAAQPNWTLVASRDDLDVFTARRTLSYFDAGRGRIAERGLNRLVIDDVAGDDVILRYHFVDRLTAQAPATVEPVLLPGVKRPFVRVRPNGEKRVVLSIR